jgi:hypothetical protein
MEKASFDRLGAVEQAEKNTAAKKTARKTGKRQRGYFLIIHILFGKL